MLSCKMSFKSTFIFVAFVLLAGCGSTPQPEVKLSTNILAQPETKIGYVYVSTAKEATTHIFGASCLLCYGVASALTSSLDTHLEKTIDTSELTAISELVKLGYSKFPAEFREVSLSKPVDKLKKFKGEHGFAKRDFRPLKEELGIDVLVVLQIDSHGAYRGFNGYIPTSDPQGHVSGLLYAVDLTNNAYLQYVPLVENVQPEGEWDEPPTFPSVTTSYYQATENVKEKVRGAF